MKKLLDEPDLLFPQGYLADPPYQTDAELWAAITAAINRDMTICLNMKVDCESPLK